MSDAVITHPDQITLEWLNGALHSISAFTSGCVERLDITHVEGSVNAQNAWIKLAYSSDAAGTCPARLFLKMCANPDGEFIHESEVNYYARDYVNLVNAPVPLCYDARFDPASGAYHILMQDLSDTHHNNWQTKPTLAYGSAVAQAMAKLHAHWWGEARLGKIGGAIPSAAAIERYVNSSKPGLEPMLDLLGQAIDDSGRRALFDIFAHHPAKMIERIANPIGFTLVHGDGNPGNILSPISGQGKTYLIDRQPFKWSLTTWMGVSDVAYMMAHWWEPELRRQLEIPILREYHNTLIACGIADYLWEQLLYDYRLSAVQSVYVATAFCVDEKERNKMAWAWRPQLQKAMTTFFDLRCSELFRSLR